MFAFGVPRVGIFNELHYPSNPTEFEGQDGIEKSNVEMENIIHTVIALRCKSILPQTFRLVVLHRVSILAKPV